MSGSGRTDVAGLGIRVISECALPRFEMRQIYNGQNWTPSLTAPLTLPGTNIVEGDCLLDVNGRELHATDNIDAFFDGTAGHQTVLRIAQTADGKDGRDVAVVPVDSEHGLRNLDWIDSNRRKVDALSGGKIAYIYMPNTAGAGYTNFNRYFYAQLDKQGVVLDERYNEGDFIADYVVNVLGQKLLSGARPWASWLKRLSLRNPPSAKHCVPCRKSV